MVNVAPEQNYLGRCYVSLLEHKGDLAELSSEEWLDFAAVLKQLELAIRQAFGAELFNWACLMNNAYKVHPSHPHVHWHVRPRYSLVHVPSFRGTQYHDQKFGHNYDREAKKPVGPELQQAIATELKKYV